MNIEPAICNGHLPYMWGRQGGEGGEGETWMQVVGGW